MTEADTDRIAIIGMAGRFPGAADVAELWTLCLEGRDQHPPPDRGRAGGRRPGGPHPPGVRPRHRTPGGRGGLGPGVLRLRPARGRDHRSAAPAVPGVRLDRPGGRRLRPRARTRRDRRVRRLRHPQLPAAQPARRPDVVAAVGLLRIGLGNDKDYLATVASYKLNLRGPSCRGADRLLDLAGRRPPGLPEPAHRRVRHGAGRRRGRARPAAGRATCYQEGGHPVAGRPLPRLRRRARRARVVRQRRGRRRAQAARRRAGRRRHDPRRRSSARRSTTTAAPKVGYTAPSVRGQAEA